VIDLAQATPCPDQAREGQVEVFGQAMTVMREMLVARTADTQERGESCKSLSSSPYHSSSASHLCLAALLVHLAGGGDAGGEGAVVEGAATDPPSTVAWRWRGLG
jgi:hypothetical protein